MAWFGQELWTCGFIRKMFTYRVFKEQMRNIKKWNNDEHNFVQKLIFPFNYFMTPQVWVDHWENRCKISLFSLTFWFLFTEPKGPSLNHNKTVYLHIILDTIHCKGGSSKIYSDLVYYPVSCRYKFWGNSLQFS